MFGRSSRRKAAGSRSGDGKPIEAFWKWWVSAGRASAEAGISGGGFGGFIDQITDRAKRIHPELSWELARGRHAEHALIVTAAGVPALRRIAERWYQQAPVADAVWEYHPARQADPAALANMLEFEGQKVNLKDLAFDLKIDTERDVIDVVVIHPVFTSMSPQACGSLGFLVLDWALGEDGVTRWIRGFQTSGITSSTGIPADGLIETVEALAARAGEPRWTLMGGERDGAVVMAMVAVPAKWVDHPLLDRHIEVTLPFADQTATGLPGTAALDQLRGLEDDLTARLLPTALLVAHETTRGVRTLHLYGDSDDPHLDEIARNAVSGWPGGGISSGPDPGWHAIRHLTGLPESPE
jgi:hypothetical protein